jgi:hypothetical protein
MKDSKTILDLSSEHLKSLSGHVFDLLTLSKPISPGAAVNLAKIISKLSPLLGNLIEFNVVEFLNDISEFQEYGVWKRQDPGFPDAIFVGDVHPIPGFEIKAWFPLATEITARFKDSQNHFKDDQTNVCMLAWLPDQLIYGKPYIVDVCVVSGKSIAQTRDNHYHNPPDYIVLEPEDTINRTANLQQTNTNGYKWQGTGEQFLEAQKLVGSWGPDARVYKPTPDYQLLLRKLISNYNYRLDTNFAKMDRIVHPGIESFKKKVLATKIHGLSVAEWGRLISNSENGRLGAALKERFGIQDEDASQLIE